MQCPRCGLENLPETLDCECGWEAVVVPAAPLDGYDEFDADDPVSGYTWGLVPHSPWRRRLARLALYGPTAACLAMVLYQALTQHIFFNESDSRDFYPDEHLPLIYGSNMIILMALFYLLPGRALGALPWPLRSENRLWLRQTELSGLRALWAANNPGLLGILLLALTHGLALLAQWVVTLINHPFFSSESPDILQSYLLRSAWLAFLLVLTALYESALRVLHPRPHWRITFTTLFLIIGFCSAQFSIHIFEEIFSIMNNTLASCLKGYFALFMILFIRHAWLRAARRLETEIMTPSAFNARPAPPIAGWPAWLTRANPVFRLTVGLEPRSLRRASRAFVAMFTPSITMVLIATVLWHYPFILDINDDNPTRYYAAIIYATTLVVLPILFRRILVSTPAMLRPESCAELHMANLGGYTRLWGAYAPRIGGVALLLLVETGLLVWALCSELMTKNINGHTTRVLLDGSERLVIVIAGLLPATFSLFVTFFDSALRGLNRSYFVRIIELLIYCASLFGMFALVLWGLEDRGVREDIFGMVYDEDFRLFAAILTAILFAAWLVITAWRRATRRLEEAE